jgi:hypothetical protein
MWELIVMGQIPGTQVQVNFTGWLLIIITLTGLLSIHRVLGTWRHSRFVAVLRIRRILLTSAYIPMLATRSSMQV